MGQLRFDAEQRFSCRSCGRCCSRGWDIAVTAAERELYRRAKVERLYREGPDWPEGTAQDPFEPIPQAPGFFRIRKRADGSCGFLSAENRCRIHEELGAKSKPLTCRLFPFRFHPSGEAPVVTASFSCPTVVASEGATLGEQAKDLGQLQREWTRTYPEVAPELSFVAGRSLAPATLETIREVLREMLARPDQSLRDALLRMAATLEDWSRSRVVGLDPERFADYVEVKGRFDAKSEKSPAGRPPSRVARVSARGILFLIGAVQFRMAARRRGRKLYWRLARLLLHVHGLGPRIGSIDMSAARRVRIDLEEPRIRGLAQHYLRSSLETLGTGRRPVLEEIAVAAALLNASVTLAAMRAAQAGESAVSADHLAAALLEASDVTHAAETGALARLLGRLAGGADALLLLAGRGTATPP